MSKFRKKESFEVIPTEKLGDHPGIVAGVATVVGLGFGYYFSQKGFYDAGLVEKNTGINLVRGLSALGVLTAVANVGVSAVKEKGLNIGDDTSKYNWRSSAALGVLSASLFVGSGIMADGNTAKLPSITVDQAQQPEGSVKPGDSEGIVNIDEWPCQIYAPIQPSNGSRENIGSAVALQRWLHDEVGYPEEYIDGNAGTLTAEYVDIVQENVGVDPAQPWNTETCLDTPFARGSVLPPTGGINEGWAYYEEFIAQD